MTTIRLRTLIIVFSALIPLLLTVALITLYTYRFKEYAINNLIIHGKAITANIVFSVADDLFTENYAPLQDFVQGIIQDDIDDIQISDVHWNIVASSDMSMLGTTMTREKKEDCLYRGIEHSVCVHIDKKNGELVLSSPIVVGSLELGNTRVTLSMWYFLSHLQKMQRNGVVIGLGFWLLAVAIGFWLSRVLMRPVHNFMVATEGISQGNLNVTIPQKSRIFEFNSFGQALETMARGIASREKEVMESEKKFRHLFERAIEGIFVTNGQGRMLDVNPSFVRIMGAQSREVLLSQNLFANVFENEETMFDFQQKMDERGFVQDYEVALIKSDSHSVVVSLTCHVVYDELGNLVQYEGLIRDITAQKNAEQQIVRMRNYLNNIIESMPSMLIAVDGKGKVTQWNGAAHRLTGLDPDAAIGRDLFDIAPWFQKYARHIVGIRQRQTPITLYREQLTLDSGHFYDITFFPLVANGVEGLAIRLDDITELDRKEQQLRQAQKMESVGTLAGGLAHDFNNVLTAILGNLSLLQYRLRGNKEVTAADTLDYLQRMQEAGQRAVDMVRQLLTLSRRHQIELVPVDLNLTIKHVRKLGESTFDKSVRVVLCPAEVPAMVMADTTEMEQVTLNLCINGIHAMTIMRDKEVWGGTLTIAIDKVEADPLFKNNHPEALGSFYWKLSVTDTGIGMDPHICAQIFDPFFTTKGQGKGTGLGLAMVYSIVKQQQGFIDVYSEQGNGTTISVYLPVLEREEGPASVSVAALAQITRGSGLILVVDDDELVRNMAINILETVGYTVLSAEDGAIGVEKYRQRHTDIKAVLLDMAMPVMSGREAFLEMQKINPAVKVLLASGFRKDERVEEILGLGVKDFLQKPYTIASLAVAIKKVIES